MSKYWCVPVLSSSSFWREPPIQFQHFKIYVTSSLGTRLSQVLPKFEPFHFWLYSHFFKFKNLRTPVFKLGPVLCTHDTFPNAKDDDSTKLYDKLKIGAYVTN
jgi:hypothetical protein